ncbi:MAG: VWA domain-containing protein [Acidobacteriota bacterium]
MSGKKSFSYLRLGLLLIVCSLIAGWEAIQAQGQSGQSGQSERPRRVNPDTTDTQQPQENKPKPQPGQPGQTTNQSPKPADPQTKQPPQQGEQGQKPGVKQQEPEPETIRINSRLVTVPVSVTDANGVPVQNLTAEDFVLEEDGTKQQVQTLGEPGKTPIEMVLLFDVSRSIRNRFDFEREAAGRFLKEAIKPGDGISIFSIGTKPVLSVPRTNQAEKAVAGALSITPTDESTAFYDTVVKAAQHITDSSNPDTRRVMITLSDGEDTNSVRFKLGDALRELQRAECLFYSINPSGPSIYLNVISVKGQEGMFKLANETGGMAFLPNKIEDLPKVFAQITAELQAQYLLGYYSSNEAADGKFRRIVVKMPKRSELRIRARNGYFAPKE